MGNPWVVLPQPVLDCPKSGPDPKCPGPGPAGEWTGLDPDRTLS